MTSTNHRSTSRAGTVSVGTVGTLTYWVAWPVIVRGLITSQNSMTKILLMPIIKPTDLLVPPRPQFPNTVTEPMGFYKPTLPPPFPNLSSVALYVIIIICPLLSTDKCHGALGHLYFILIFFLSIFLDLISLFILFYFISWTMKRHMTTVIWCITWCGVIGLKHDGRN